MGASSPIAAGESWCGGFERVSAQGTRKASVAGKVYLRSSVASAPVRPLGGGGCWPEPGVATLFESAGQATGIRPVRVRTFVRARG